MIARAAVIASIAAVASATALDQSPSRTRPELPATAESAYRAVSTHFDERDALSIVSFMDQYWRLAGNPGFNASSEDIHSHLEAARYTSGSTAGLAHVHVEEFPNSARGWDYRAGTVEFEGGSDAPPLSREQDRVSLAINSFSTPAAGIVAPLVDVGPGAAADYDGKELKGAVVLGDAPLGRLWQEGMSRGAAGVIST